MKTSHMASACPWLIALAALAFSPLAVAAEIHRWVDENGVIHYTDKSKVPEKYRGDTEKLRVAPAIAPERASAPLLIRSDIAIVQALFNDRTYANLVVDTGATMTVISRAVARELGIDIESGKFPTAYIQTANGVVSAPIVTIDSIQVGGMEVQGLQVTVQDISPAVSGLLGMNFLSHFRMDIDHKTSLLYLERK